jgi:hypothetical protein
MKTIEFCPPSPTAKILDTALGHMFKLILACFHVPGIEASRYIGRNITHTITILQMQYSDHQ